LAELEWPEGGPEKEGWERRGGRREISEGGWDFIVWCRLEHLGTAPTSIGGAKPEGAVHRYAVNRLLKLPTILQVYTITK